MVDNISHIISFFDFLFSDQVVEFNKSNLSSSAVISTDPSDNLGFLEILILEVKLTINSSYTICINFFLGDENFAVIT